MLIYNSWYVAAEPHELDSGPLARTILNMPVVLFKTESGKVAALEDRCPHRFVPLSLGKVVGENIQCGYHGAQFGVTGAFQLVPGQNTVPNSCVKRYPTTEKHGYIWIWMGAPELSSDTSSIPEFFYRGDHPGWDGGYGHFESIQAGYGLINDNLFDITHAEYVHPGSFGGEEMRFYRRLQEGDDFVDQNTTFSVGARNITFRVRSLNMEAGGPFYRWMVSTSLGVEHYAGKVDLDMQVDWGAPSYTSFLLNSRPSGKTPAEGAQVCNMHAVTPETETSSHYFYRSVKNYGGEELVGLFMDGVKAIFDQDKPILEAQQRNIGDQDVFSMKSVSFAGDLLYRKARLINQGMANLEKNASPQP